MLNDALVYLVHLLDLLGMSVKLVNLPHLVILVEVMQAGNLPEMVGFPHLVHQVNHVSLPHCSIIVHDSYISCHTKVKHIILVSQSNSDNRLVSTMRGKR